MRQGLRLQHTNTIGTKLLLDLDFGSAIYIARNKMIAMVKKGLELPINVVVIVAITVLVLVAIGAFFLTNFGSGVGTISLEQALASSCNNLRALYGCQANSISSVISQDYKINNKECSLADICSKKGAANAAQCLRLCGCTVSDGDEQITPALKCLAR